MVISMGSEHVVGRAPGFRPVVSKFLGMELIFSGIVQVESVIEIRVYKQSMPFTNREWG